MEDIGTTKVDATAFDADEPFFLDHPEVESAFGRRLVGLIEESDRGAVLVGTALVDHHLRRLFESRFVRDISPNSPW